MTTKELLTKARKKGITIKLLSEMTNINLYTLYGYSQNRSISKEKEDKLRNVLIFLIDS